MSNSHANGVIAWFVRNPIAANLLMLLLILGGIFSLPRLNIEMFPASPADSISVNISYPGAAPGEVEEQISLRLEESVSDLDGIEELMTRSSRGSAYMEITVIPGYPVEDMLNEVKARVDAINSLPGDAERPLVKERIWRRDIMEVAVAAEMDERSLKQLAEQVRDSLTVIPGVDYVEIEGSRSGEISIEISEQALRRYNLTFEKLSSAIRRSSVNMSAGQVRTEEGSIQLRTTGQAYTAKDFEEIVVLQNPDGTRVLLGEVAKVTDSFEDVKTRTRFNGKPAMFVEVFNVHDPDVIETSEKVNEKVTQLQSELPEGVELTIWRDRSVYLQDRIELLGKNAVGGLILVFILLMLFLRPILAFWVAAGIGVAYLGTLALMPILGISINILTLFAFLLVLGIVVDDAIVVGESVHAHYERGMRDEDSAIVGTRNVLKPVVVAVVTTLMVFGAMLLLPEASGMRLFQVVPLVALPALALSLLESFWILPSHLRHMKPERVPVNPVMKALHDTRIKFSHGMSWFASNPFARFVTIAVNQRITTVVSFVGVLVLLLAVVSGGWVKTNFWPQISGETVSGDITLQEGLAWEDVQQTALQIESAISSLKDDPRFSAEDGQSVVKNVRLRVRDSSIDYRLEMLSAELHNISSRTLELRLRELIGPIQHIETFESRSSMGRRPSKDMSFELSGPESATLKQATSMVRDYLSRMPGVGGIEDSIQKGVPELEFELKEGAEALDVGLSDIARQLRQGFYGEEVQRIPRLREDVKVMVRYPESERQNLETLKEFRIRTGDGREVPLEAVAEARYTTVPPSIIRNDRKRTVTIGADLVDDTQVVGAISAEIIAYFEGQVRPLFPRVDIKLDGAEEDRKEFEGQFILMNGLVVLGIFGLIAVLFRSYWQPMLVITAVPFGLAGGVFGHLVLDLPLSMMSLMGMLAAVGVVVNDNLVLIDRINQLREEGWDAYKAVIQASRDRFRPIVLTSITTFCGLMPILLEKSTQAQWLIPTAVSLAWGVMAATFVTLLLVPCLYMIGEDVKAAFLRQFGGKTSQSVNE